MNNLDRANNEVINRIHPLPSDQLEASRDGNHWFSPWPWMFCGSCLQTANYVHQYRRALLSQWHPSKGGREPVCVQGSSYALLALVCSRWETLCLQADKDKCVYACVYLRNERNTDRDNALKSQSETWYGTFLSVSNQRSRCCSCLLWSSKQKHIL